MRAKETPAEVAKGMSSFNIPGCKNIGLATPAEAPAYSLEAELSTLGGLMLDNRAWPDVSSIVQQADFHEEKNRILFRAIQDLAEAGKPFDAVTVLDKLERAGKLADAGGATWLGQTVRDTPSAANVIHYAQIVRRKSLERQRAIAIKGENYDHASELTATIKALEYGISGASLRTIDEILARPITYDWLIKGWLERQQTIVLWGESQSYKSLLAIEMACAIATGTEWRGNRVKQGAVLYIAGEGGGSGITRRFTAWQIANQQSLSGCPLILRETSTRLPEDTGAVIQETEQFLKDRGWKLEMVILDTLARTMVGDENSQKDFGGYQHALDMIRDKFQCAAMILHHTGHVDKTRARGSSAIRANTDVELSMEPAGDKISRLHVRKTKDATAQADMFLALSVVDLGVTDEDGVPIDSVVLRHLKDYRPAPAIQKLGKNEKVAVAVLKENGRSMLVEDLRKATQELLKAEHAQKGYSEVPPGTLKSAWSRTLRGLKSKGVVIESDDGKTVSLPDGLQRLQNGCMQPNATEGEERLQRLHTSLEVQPCNHPATGSGSPGVRQEVCIKCNGTGELEIDGKVGGCMACVGRGYVDLLKGSVQSLEPESLISEFHDRRGTTGAGGRVAKVVAFPNATLNATVGNVDATLNATATGNRSDGNAPPDYGGSDDNYFASMPEFQPGAAPDLESELPPMHAAGPTTQPDCRHCGRHAPHACTCKALNVFCDPMLEPLCGGKHFEPKEVRT